MLYTVCFRYLVKVCFGVLWNLVRVYLTVSLLLTLFWFDLVWFWICCLFCLTFDCAFCLIMLGFWCDRFAVSLGILLICWYDGLTRVGWVGWFGFLSVFILVCTWLCLCFDLRDCLVFLFEFGLLSLDFGGFCCCYLFCICLLLLFDLRVLSVFCFSFRFWNYFWIARVVIDWFLWVIDCYLYDTLLLVCLYLRWSCCCCLLLL